MNEVFLRKFFNIFKVIFRYLNDHKDNTGSNSGIHAHFIKCLLTLNRDLEEEERSPFIDPKGFKACQVLY